MKYKIEMFKFKSLNKLGFKVRFDFRVFCFYYYDFIIVIMIKICLILKFFILKVLLYLKYSNIFKNLNYVVVFYIYYVLEIYLY